MRLRRKAPETAPPTEFCRLCEAPSAPGDSLCSPCRQWADADFTYPVPPQVRNTVARIFEVSETN